jgi:hypothetical protein
MKYPSASPAKEYFYKMSDSITKSQYIYTDENYNPVQNTQNGITYKRLTAGPITYGNNVQGKTVRINVNAGSFIATQAYNWKNTPGYIWTPADSRNVEFTYYFRLVNLVQSHTTCSSKMRGGIHSGTTDPRASCFETTMFINGGESNKIESAYEYNHPDYVFSGITPLIPNSSKANIWIGRKTICWNGSDGKVHVEEYIDWTPFDSSGKPTNKWQKFFTQVFAGTSTNSYTKIPTWGGMYTYRQDGFQYVDIAIISIREIVPPT